MQRVLARRVPELDEAIAMAFQEQRWLAAGRQVFAAIPRVNIGSKVANLSQYAGFDIGMAVA